MTLGKVHVLLANTSLLSKDFHIALKINMKLTRYTPVDPSSIAPKETVNFIGENLRVTKTSRFEGNKVK